MVQPKQSVKEKQLRANGDETRHKILAAAKQLFVEYGYAGTSMAKIAALAEVNHSLLFHHFKNKKTLWYETKVFILEQHTGQDTRLPSTQQPFADFLSELVHSHLEHFKNQDIVRMLAWQRMEASDDVRLGSVRSAEMERWLTGFAQYQQRGDIDPALSVEFVITMVLGIISSAALDKISFIASEDSRRDYADFIVQRLLKAFAA